MRIWYFSVLDPMKRPVCLSLQLSTFLEFNPQRLSVFMDLYNRDLHKGLWVKLPWRDNTSLAVKGLIIECFFLVYFKLLPLLYILFVIIFLFDSKNWNIEINLQPLTIMVAELINPWKRKKKYDGFSIILKKLKA